jgi:hypothetical protein
VNAEFLLSLTCSRPNYVGSHFPIGFRVEEIGSFARRFRRKRVGASAGGTRLPDDPNSQLDRYANSGGVFVLVCSGSLEANGVKKPHRDRLQSFDRGDPTEFVCGPGTWSQPGRAEVSRR